jgi:hypothetical protein
MQRREFISLLGGAVATHGRSRQARCNLTEFDALKPGTAGAQGGILFLPGFDRGR